MQGVEKLRDSNYLTVFSCTNFGGVNKNKAGIILFNKKNELKLKIMDYKESNSVWQMNRSNQNQGGPPKG